MSARPKEHWTCQSMTRNLRLKIEEWKKDNPQSSFFFRPFHSTSQTEQTDSGRNTVIHSAGRLAERAVNLLWQHSHFNVCHIQDDKVQHSLAFCVQEDQCLLLGSG